MSRLMPPEARAEAIIYWYYYWLNQDQEFLAALGALFRRLTPLAAQLKHLADATGLSQDPRFPVPDPGPFPDTPIGRAFRDHWLVRKEIERELSRFAETWPLPRKRALEDLWFSYQPAEGSGEARLRRAPLLGTTPPVGIQVVSARAAVTIVYQVPIIFPVVPLPFVWDPTLQDRKELNDYIDALCADLRASILAQADEYERQVRQAGWAPLPPAYHVTAAGEEKRKGKQTVKETAWLIYLRAVKGLTWGQLAIKVVASAGRFSQLTEEKRAERARRLRPTVRRRVTRAAALAEIPLKKC